MKFHRKQQDLQKRYNCAGTRTRYKRKFLWLPVTLYGITRWLEYAGIRETIVYNPFENKGYFWQKETWYE